MRYLFIALWAGLQICFAHLFLGSFLELKRNREECFWVLLLTWLVNAIFGMFEVGGLHGYLVYLLMAVLLLLVLYREFGLKGLCLLVTVLSISAVVDLAALHLSAGMTGLVLYLILTGGKVLPILFALMLRYLGLLPSDDRSAQQDRDTLLLRQHMEMQQESMSALEQNYRVQRKNSHEFEHHMQVLRDLLARQETDAAQEYLDRLKKNRSMNVMSISSSHPVIDVILNQKYQTARENDIKMQIQVNDLSRVKIPADSLVVVLTNLLDNAIEACRRIDGYREIICTILQEDALYISIRNTSLPVSIVEGKIPTSKADALSHGFGLVSVSFVLDELGAEYTFGYESGWFRFAAEIDE